MQRSRMLFKLCRTRERSPFLNSLKMRAKENFASILKFDAQEFKNVLVCVKHFMDDVINKNEKRFWLIQLEVSKLL